MTPKPRDCPASEVRPHDWLTRCPLPDGSEASGRVLSVARVRTSELKIEVNGLTITYPGSDAVVLQLRVKGGVHTLDLKPDLIVTREDVQP